MFRPCDNNILTDKQLIENANSIDCVVSLTDIMGRLIHDLCSLHSRLIYLRHHQKSDCREFDREKMESETSMVLDAADNLSRRIDEMKLIVDAVIKTTADQYHSYGVDNNK